MQRNLLLMHFHKCNKDFTNVSQRLPVRTKSPSDVQQRVHNRKRRFCRSAVSSPLLFPLTGESETNFNVVLETTEWEWYLQAPSEIFNLTPRK